MYVGWTAGAASAAFTPHDTVWMAGYGARREPSRGVISDLYASALVLRDATQKPLVLVSADIIAISREVADEVAHRVSKQHDIPRGNFIFAASHTHFGPEVRMDKVLFFKIPPEYAQKIPGQKQRLIDAMIKAVEGAMADLSPVTIEAKKTTAGFAHNRRPHGDINDHDVPVLDIRKPDGSRKAVVFGYACHNTTIDPQDRRFCGDWAGFAKQHLQDWNPGCTPLFITGCGADQNPDPRGTVELSQQYGRELADAVQNCLQQPGQNVEPMLNVAMEDVRLEMQKVTPESIEEALASDDPPRKVKAQYLKDWLAREGKIDTTYSAPLQAVRLGKQVLMVVMSGETVIDWTHKFKKEFSAPLVWVAGYCNDMYGYVPTQRIQREGGYEGGRANLWSAVPAPWTESVEQIITDGIRRVVGRVMSQ